MKRKAQLRIIAILSFFILASVLFALIPSITLISADVSSSTSYDTIRYDEKDLKVIFEDGGIEKGDIYLRSHNSTDEIISVSGGWTVNMYYDTNFKDLQTNVLQDPIFLDLETGEIVDRQWKYVKYVIEERERDICNNYEQILLNDTNSTNESYINGECLSYSKEKYQFQGWEDYNSRDIPKGASRLGLMVYNLPNDKIDGIWKIGGNSITKHAGWQTSYETDLVSWYKLDGTTGAVIDSHGTNDGTNYGATRGVTGQVNNAFDFDGVNDYVNTNTNILLNSAYTISFWFNPDTVGDNEAPWTGDTKGNIIQKAISSYGHQNYAIKFDENRKIRYIGHRTSGEYDLVSNTQLSLNNWYFVTVTTKYGSGGYTKIYINGLEDSSFLNSNSIYSVSLQGKTTIGAGYKYDETSLNYFDGTIDEVGIWSRALSSEEVEEIYQMGLDGYSYGDEFITCTFSGYVFDENNNALEGANVTIWNQYNISEFYSNTTDATGLWEINISNSTNTYMAGAYYNNTLIGQLKPYISGEC